MTNEAYTTGRAKARFGVAAAATAVVGLVAGWGARTAVRRAALVGAAVAAGDYALYRLFGGLPDIEGELDERADEIEVEIEDAAAEE